MAGYRWLIYFCLKSFYQIAKISALPAPVGASAGHSRRRPRRPEHTRILSRRTCTHIPSCCFLLMFGFAAALSGGCLRRVSDGQRALALWKPMCLRRSGGQPPEPPRSPLGDPGPVGPGHDNSVWAGMTVSTPYPPSGKAPSVRYRGHRRKWPTTSPGEEGKPK